MPNGTPYHDDDTSALDHPQDGMTDAIRASILDSLGRQLAAKRSYAIQARVSQGIDERWFGDVEAYEGRDEVTRYYAGLRDAVQGYVMAADPKQMQARSKLVVNVTRGKVNASAARLMDIALPTDDRNWDLRPSTVPELADDEKSLGLMQNGKPVMVNDSGRERQATMADVADLDMEKAKKAAEAMRKEIDDQLDLSADGSGFEGVVRAIMFDEALLGVGVAKGPVNTSRVKKVWMPIASGGKTVHVLQRRKDVKPNSTRVNPWDIYPHPECGEHPTKFPLWERLPGITAADLRGFASTPGYLVDQIKQVLVEGPKRAEMPAQKPNDQIAVVTDDTAFEGWEYHGELTRQELQAAGCKCGEDDVFTSYSACVIMVNDTVIKADIEILDTEDMPYDFFVTEKCSGSWCGYGTSFLARSAQRAITAGWRAMLDNAGWFGGPQIVMHRKRVQPADGTWQLRGPKLWYYTGDDETADMEKMFAVHQIDSRQAEFANIIKMGMEFLDNETMLPTLAQGEQGTATDVLGGMNLLLNASNVMIRRKLKCFDDQFTIRHIGRYVDWNMQYNPKTEIKGDFEVQARASGALFDTEAQNKTSANLLALTMNPAIAHGMKKWDIVRRMVRAMRFDPADFVKPDKEIEKIEQQMAKQGGPQDPRIAAAQIKAQADMQITQMELQDSAAERELKLMIAQMDAELAKAGLTTDQQKVLSEIKARLTDTVIKVRAQQQITRDNQVLDLHKYQSDVMRAPTEPPGRAPAGQAFAR
jgi:hypothetical protein